MADEATEEVELEQDEPVIEDDETDEPIEAENEEEAEETEADSDDADDDAEQDTDEEVDLDFAFKKYRVPKSLADDVTKLRADYTQKTQGISAREKELNERAERLEQQSNATDEDLALRAELNQIEKNLEGYKKWGLNEYQAFRNQDPFEADRHWNVKQGLIQRRAELSEQIASRQEAKSQEAQQDFAKRVEETIKFASETIPDFSPQKDAEITNFAIEQGIEADTLKKIMSPSVYKLMHLAHVGGQLMDKQAKPAPKPKAAKKPTTTVKPKAGSAKTGLSDDLSAEEWMKRRNAQVRRQAG